MLLQFAEIVMRHATESVISCLVWERVERKILMKILSGAVFLVGAEQAFAHAMLVQFPNQGTASTVLIPASVIMLAIGSLLVLWGLWSEIRSNQAQKKEAVTSLRNER